MAARKTKEERMIEKPPLVLSNFNPLTDKVVYTNDRGAWNVDRALRDCMAGKHRIYLNDVEEAHAASAAVEVDEAKVQNLMQKREFLETTVLLGVVDDGMTWFIDGHHRLRAMYRVGVKDFAAWIIEEADSFPYKIFYNGQRLPPWKMD